MVFLHGAALIAGIANAVQPGTTTQLAKSLGQPFTAGLVSMMVRTAAMLAVGLVSGRLQVPSLQQMGGTP